MKFYLLLLTVSLLPSAICAQESASALDAPGTTKQDVIAAKPVTVGDSLVKPAAEDATLPVSLALPKGASQPDTAAWRPSKARSTAVKAGEPDDLDLESGFQWSTAVRQSLLFLGIQHGYAMTQPKTRSALKGPFFRDYFRSVKRLHGWKDGGRFFTNYVAHPMQGSFTGFIQVQNDPKGRRLHFENTKDYWVSRLKATAWSAAWSTQFEIGPVSQASIGNVGMSGKQTWVDIVVTPTVGSAMLMTEDAVDRFVIRKLERRFPQNFWLKIFARMLLNPTRTVANTIAFKAPWRRHTQR